MYPTSSEENFFGGFLSFLPNALAFCEEEQYNNFEFTIKVGKYMNDKEFDLDFDFEKEYGIDLPKDVDTSAIDDDLDLKAILESDFTEEAELFHAEYQNDFDYGPEDTAVEADPVEEEPDLLFPEVSDPAQRSIEDLMDEDDDLFFDDDDQPDEELPEEAAVEEPVRRRERKPSAARWNPLKQRPAPEPQEPKAEDPAAPKRKPVSKMRQFKNETLPLLILGMAAVLIVFFVVGSVTRLIGNSIRNNQQELQASESKMNEEQRLALEAQNLLDEAALLAAGYDYDGAIAKLESYSGNISEHSEITMRLSEYKQTMNSLIAHNDPAVPNLSFHMLIADPSRAFTNQKWGDSYNKNFVTVDEFQKILEQLYENGYVLVEMEHFIAETVTGDTVTYSSKPIYLPDGKKPIMITETMVNYYNYMIDGSGDGIPDKEGAGFASKLVVDDLTGNIQAEMVNASGETVRGDYDLVPILEKFIEEHPDFSYKGARATLAITGDEGIFGYRINSTTKNTKGEDYYNKEVEGAKKIVAALKEKGYELACYTYSNIDYGKKSANDIQADISSWKVEIMPVVGTLDTIVYAKSSDISSTGTYTGSKYNVLYDAGFRFFIGNGNVPSAEVNSAYVRQKRLMVTGQYMAHTAGMYKDYFDAKVVLNSLRGNVPQ